MSENTDDPAGQPEPSDAQRADELQKRLGNVPELLAEVLNYVQSVVTLPETWPGASPAGEFFALLSEHGSGRRQQQQLEQKAEEILSWPTYESPPLGDFEGAPSHQPPELGEMAAPMPVAAPIPEDVAPSPTATPPAHEFVPPEPFERFEGGTFELPSFTSPAIEEASFEGFQPLPGGEMADFPSASMPPVADFESPEAMPRDRLVEDGQEVFNVMPQFAAPSPSGIEAAGPMGAQTAPPVDMQSLGQYPTTEPRGMGETPHYKWGDIHVPDLDAEEGFPSGSPSVRVSNRAGMRGAGGQDFGSRFTHEPAILSGQGGRGPSRGQLLDFTDR